MTFTGTVDAKFGGQWACTNEWPVAPNRIACYHYHECLYYELRAFGQLIRIDTNFTPNSFPAPTNCVVTWTQTASVTSTFKLFESTAYEIDYATNQNCNFTVPTTIDIQSGGSYSISADVEEWATVYSLDETDPNRADSLHYPTLPVLDTSGYIVGYGSAQQDGLTSRGVVFFEQLKVGGTLSLSWSGKASNSVNHTITAGESASVGAINYYGDVRAFNRAVEDTQTTVITHIINGIGISAPYSKSANGCSFNCTSSFTLTSVDADGNLFTNHESYGYMLSGLRTTYTLDGRAKSFADGYSGSLPVRILYRSINGNLATQISSLSPSISTSWDQDVYSAFCTLNGASQTSDGYDRRAAARLWIDSTSTEDSRDWRCMFRGYKWDALGISHSAFYALDPCTALTKWTAGPHTTLSLPLGADVKAVVAGGIGSFTLSTTTKRVWEGYRWLRIIAKADTNRAVVVAAGGAQWTINLTAISQTFDLDLTDSGTETASQTIKNTRFPLSLAGGYPTNTDPTIQYAMCWGVNFADSIAFQLIADGATIDVTAIQLQRNTSATCDFLLGFKNELVGWASPSDNTSIYPFWTLNVDGKISDWPSWAHVVPFSGTPYYRYFSGSDMQTFMSYLPGMNVALLTAPTDGYHGIGLESELLGGAGATYQFSTGVWSEWVGKDITIGTVNVPMQDLWDEVQAYPGAGRGVWDGSAYDPLNPQIPLAMTKHIRGRAQGIDYNTSNTPAASKTVVAYEVLSTSTSAGTGSSSSNGSYVTAAPYGRYKNIRTEYRFGTLPYLSNDDIWTNRGTQRTNFRKAGGNLERSVWCHEDKRGWMWQASTDTVTTNIVVRRADSVVPLPSWAVEVVATSGGFCDNPRVWVDPALQRAYLVFDFRSTPTPTYDSYICFSDDDGATWSTPQILMANARFPDGCASWNGDQIMSWVIYDSGTTGSSTIYGQFRAGGDTAWGSAIQFFDDTGSLIHVADAGWGNIQKGFASYDPWVMAIVVNGETTPSTWICTDETALVWHRVT